LRLRSFLLKGTSMTEVQGWIVIALVVVAIFSQWLTVRRS
jgi:hypothetical protein